MYINLEPVCPLFVGFEPSKRRPFPFKTRVIWVPGIYYVKCHECIHLDAGVILQVLSLQILTFRELIAWDDGMAKQFRTLQGINTLQHSNIDIAGVSGAE